MADKEAKSEDMTICEIERNTDNGPLLSLLRRRKSVPWRRPSPHVLQDPSAAALRVWADDMSNHITDQDGSISADWPSDEGFGWPANRLDTRKGDTILPPDGRIVHGKAKSVGRVDDGKRKDDNEQAESG